MTIKIVLTFPLNIRIKDDTLISLMSNKFNQQSNFDKRNVSSRNGVLFFYLYRLLP